MVTILIEAVLFVALLRRWARSRRSPFATPRSAGRIVQTRNRRRIERRAEVAAATRCPTHGQLRERDLVRLPAVGRSVPSATRSCFDVPE
jgi:hypothetical protein